MYRKKKITTNKTESSSELLIPYEKKKVALGVLFIVFSILLLLSIISYTETDKAYFIDLRFKDILSIFDKNSDIAQNLSKINNWLGLFGAILGNFLIHGTIGYFSVVFPILLFIWGVAFIKLSDYRKIGFYSNILLGSGILLATLFGVLGNSIEFFHQKTNLYGIVGGVLSDLTIKILGSAGSLIVISSLLVLTCFLIMDIDFKKVIDFPVYLWRKVFNKNREVVKTKIATEKSKPNNKKDDEEKITVITEPITPPTKINRMIE
ncbi:MAG: DNA translocase FtsK 4TM domain-containing protein, partial [Leptospiraceae bacterium]|nr:DNA translocase FtsK 4TM domain-containing protein [Leptospiraceae bacterium]